MDGAFCDFSEKEKMDYFKKCHDDFGVRNFEMEATMMMAFCKRANISCAGNTSKSSNSDQNSYQRYAFSALIGQSRNCFVPIGRGSQILASI